MSEDWGYRGYHRLKAAQGLEVVLGALVSDIGVTKFAGLGAGHCLQSWLRLASLVKLGRDKAGRDQMTRGVSNKLWSSNQLNKHDVSMTTGHIIRM